MNELEPSGMRISHDERDQALDALTEHSRAGRLTPDEYGDRATALNDIRTKGELQELFRDLPAPRPETGAAQMVAPQGTRKEVAEHSAGGRTHALRYRLARASVPASGVASVGLTYATGNWLFMLITAPAVYVIESALRKRRGSGG